MCEQSYRSNVIVCVLLIHVLVREWTALGCETCVKVNGKSSEAVLDRVHAGL